MRDKIKRVVCSLFVLLVLAGNLPLRACAIDPVSAATISNAFAQAITAYGASNGVSMIFDGVTSSDSAQIGERMHDLWRQFRLGQQTADDYETLAAAIFPGLYSKAITAGGNAVVALHLADTYLPDIDDFWNWVLSGPAEMVKVDNAYQWNLDNNDDVIKPIVFASAPGAYFVLPDPGISHDYTQPAYYPEALFHGVYVTSTKALVFPFIYKDTGYGIYRLCALSTEGDFRVASQASLGASIGISTSTAQGTSNGVTYNWLKGGRCTPSDYPDVPQANDFNTAVALALGQLDNMDSLSVAPYVGDAVAKPVPIPDTSDPDYGPLPYIGNLPIPWNDTLFGDGTGSLTDAQSDAITSAIDDAIVANPDKTIEMENTTTDDPDIPTTDDPPSNDPDDYAVPGLQNIFPFCIPFDVYNFLSALAAEPTAPHFTATLQFPAAIGGPQTIDIDFNNQTFNTLAGILRTLELLAFIVGLALLTRSMFIRG